MNAQSILTALEKQPIVYHKSADYQRYILLRKDALSLVLYDEEFKEKETCVLWGMTPTLGHIPWVTPEAPIFTPEIAKNFYPVLSAWVQLFQRRCWDKVPPLLDEIVRAIHTYCQGASYEVFLVKEGLPLNQAEPWEIKVENIEENYLYDA